MATLKVKFKKEKTTPNTYRFGEIDGRGAFVEMNRAQIGSIYIKKSVFGPDIVPERIEVSVEVVESK
jgi:hypothetical protein